MVGKTIDNVLTLFPIIVRYGTGDTLMLLLRVSMLTLDLLILVPGTWNRSIVLYQLEETK